MKFTFGLFAVFMALTCFGFHLAIQQIAKPIEVLSHEVGFLGKDIFLEGPRSEIPSTFQSEAVKITEISRVFRAVRGACEQAQIEFLKRKEIERQNALTEVAVQLAHDIRSPLAALKMLIPFLSNESKEVGEILKVSASRIEKIANDLLERRRDLNIKPNERKVPIPCLTLPLLEELLVQKRIEYGEKGEISLLVDRIDPNEGVRADPTLLSRILSNLIDNAKEASEGGEKIKINVSLRKRNGNHEIIVADQGKGIEASVLKRLGKEAISADKGNGNGLALFQASKWIEEWGGELRIDSEVGQGTSVTLGLRSLLDVPAADYHSSTAS